MLDKKLSLPFLILWITTVNFKTRK